MAGRAGGLWLENVTVIRWRHLTPLRKRGFQPKKTCAEYLENYQATFSETALAWVKRSR